MKHCPACNAEIANDLKNCGRHGVSTDEELPRQVENPKTDSQREVPLSNRDTLNQSFQKKLEQAREVAKSEREKAGV